MASACKYVSTLCGEEAAEVKPIKGKEGKKAKEGNWCKESTEK